jgi:electron transport complex protein RnfD
MIEQNRLTPIHHHDGTSVRNIMRWVCLCLLPGILYYTWFSGIGVLIQCLIAIFFALIIEAACLKIRKQDLAPFLCDGSVIVTAIIFALMISPDTPWWVSLTGIGFGLIFGKHIYGGLGHNLFNPAVVAIVFVLLCFPDHLNHWSQAMSQQLHDEESFKNVLTQIFSNPAISQGLQPENIGTFNNSFRRNGIDSISAWTWLSLFYFLGAIVLLVKGIISWHIPIAILGSLFVTSQAFNLYDPALYTNGAFYVLSAGGVLAAFYIATDPVTSPTTPSGKLIYGVMIGILIFTIRAWGAHPDGIAFAILIANGMTPMIDDYFCPAVKRSCETA